VSVRAEPLGRFDRSRLLAPRSIGAFGILLGAISFWVALPPVLARNVVASLLLGILAIACGIWAASRAERRVGWGAIVAGVLGIVLALLATQSGEGNLKSVVVWSALIAAMLRFATPLTFAAIGGMFSERSGVVNIGLEGMMLMGTFFGIWGADKFGHWYLGLVAAMVAGGALALVHAFFAINLRADQIVGGTAVNFLALGVTGYMFVDIYGSNGTPNLSNAQQIPDVTISTSNEFFASAFGQLNLMIWGSFLLLIVSYVVMFRTPIGLRIRSVGEHPRAADTVGISVYATRYAAVTLSGVLAALGGAYLSIGFVHSFNQNMTAGRGFIALAALIFGKWRPFGAFGAALLFGFSSALAQRLGGVSDWSSYAVLFQTLPYILTLVAVAGVIGRSIPPAAVGRPYKKQ
jgi:simple sugar transport system permease protein